MVIMSCQDVPSGVMDLLRIFLGASSRGESAVLTLETRGAEISSSYRSVSKAGSPAPAIAENKKKCKKNPARVQRSRLRLEKFLRKKEETRENTESCKAAGDTSNKLVIELDKVEDGPVEKSLGEILCPIPQVDGQNDKEEIMKFEFISNYADEDIQYTLEELFLETSFHLQSVKQCAPRSADYLFNVTVNLSPGQRNSWPNMQPDQAEVFKHLKKLVT